MTQAYPSLEDTQVLHNPEAERWGAAMKAFVTAARGLKKMSEATGKNIVLYVEAPNKETLTIFEKVAKEVEALVNVTIKYEHYDGPGSTEEVEGVRLTIPINAEQSLGQRAVWLKEQGQLLEEQQKINRRLQDNLFRTRAPAHVVEAVLKRNNEILNRLAFLEKELGDA